MSTQVKRYHTLQDIRQEYDRLDKLCGLDTSHIQLKISTRMIKGLGNFRYPVNGGTDPLCITIAQSVLGNEEKFYDTIRHEYAHAAVYLLFPGEDHGHDAVWRAMCLRIGCSPRRIAETTEEERAQTIRRAKYKIVCSDCGEEYYYFRTGKTVNMLLHGQGRDLRCGRCNGNRLVLYTRG